jgi:anti-sigma B factor antagonist
MGRRVTGATAPVSAAGFACPCRTNVSVVSPPQENRLELRRQGRVLHEQGGAAYAGTRARPSSDNPLPLFRSAARSAGGHPLAAAARIHGGATEPAFDCTAEKLPAPRTGGPEPVLLRADGEVDTFTAPMLRRCLEDAAHEPGAIVLDLSSLSYLDASGIHVIEDFHGAHAGRLIVFGARPNVRKILEIVNLHELVPVVHTLEQALEHLRRA